MANISDNKIAYGRKKVFIVLLLEIDMEMAVVRLIQTVIAVGTVLAMQSQA
jgi:hypothetical protein